LKFPGDPQPISTTISIWLLSPHLYLQLWIVTTSFSQTLSSISLTQRLTWLYRGGLETPQQWAEDVTSLTDLCSSLRNHLLCLISSVLTHNLFHSTIFIQYCSRRRLNPVPACPFWPEGQVSEIIL
jgi:hypothetical protein